MDIGQCKIDKQNWEKEIKNMMFQSPPEQREGNKQTVSEIASNTKQKGQNVQTWLKGRMIDLYFKILQEKSEAVEPKSEHLD